MDNETEDLAVTDGMTELAVTWELYQRLVALKEKNNGTPAGRMWAIAATDCEKLLAWIGYSVTEAAS